MTLVKFGVRKFHIDYFSVAPISEILMQREAVDSHFSVFTDLQSYLKFYQQAFIQNHRKRGKEGSGIRLPFVKSLGQLLPVAAHELKHPQYQTGRGNIAYMVRSANFQAWMLPMRLFVNWKITINTEILGANKLVKFHCTPVVKINPLGIASYHLRMFFSFKEGIDLKDFITIMQSLEKRSLKVRYARKSDILSVHSLSKRFHDIMLENFLQKGCKPRDEDFEFSLMHRIITLSQIDGKITPEANEMELAAIIGLERQWNKLSRSYVQKWRGENLGCIYQDQFIMFHPSCTIIYPSEFSEKPEWNNYVSKCMRNNFTSMIEVATILKRFAVVVDAHVQQLLNVRLYSDEDRVQIAADIDDTRVTVQLLRSASIFRGHHNDLMGILDRNLGLTVQLDKIVNKLGELRRRIEVPNVVLSINEQLEIDRIVRELDEITKICSAFVDKKPIQLEKEAANATAILTIAQKTRNELKAAFEDYKAAQIDPYASDEKKFKLKTFLYQLVLSTYRIQILPIFEEFTRSLLDKKEEIIKITDEQRGKGEAILPQAQIRQELENASAEVREAVASSPIKETFGDVSSFAQKAKPYVEKIIKGAKIALTILGMVL